MTVRARDITRALRRLYPTDELSTSGIGNGIFVISLPRATVELGGFGPRTNRVIDHLAQQLGQPVEVTGVEFTRQPDGDRRAAVKVKVGNNGGARGREAGPNGQAGRGTQQPEGC